VTRFRLFIEPEVHQARNQLPGHIRQRVRRLFDDLAAEPRPAQSKLLDVAGLGVPEEIELRRLRLDPWRVIYAVNAAEGWVWVLAVRRRPPYDYEDLGELVARLG
jgi:mRNA interferase RelE/StbE